MKTNPEFRRNLWLELSPSRLVGMPLVLAAIFCLAYVSDDYTLGQGVASVAVGLYFVLSLIWGTKLASETVMNELRDHTWDGQRMSALTSWELTLGKLFGSTIYSWYAAAFTLPLYWLAASNSAPSLASRTVLALLLTGILAQSISLLASLLALQKERRYNRNQTALLLLFGLFSAGPFFSLIFNKASNVNWYGTSYASLDLLILSLIAFAAWGVIGVNRLMRLELQMKNLPGIWYAFLLFVMIYLAGFFAAPGEAATQGLGMDASAPLAAYFVVLGILYAMAFLERKDFLSLQSLLRLATNGEWRRTLERAPRWLLTLPVAVLMGVIVVITARPAIPGATITLLGFVVAQLAFLGRDLGIMLFFNLGKEKKRADMLTVISLALLYGVLPATLSVMQMSNATLLLWPRTDLSPLAGCVAALLELLLMAWLVTLRWQARGAEGQRG